MTQESCQPHTFCEACLSNALRNCCDAPAMLIDRQDVLYAVRSARRSPLLTFVVVLALRRNRIERGRFHHPQLLVPRASDQERPLQLCPNLPPLSRLVYRTASGLIFQRRRLRRDSRPVALACRPCGIAEDLSYARRRPQTERLHARDLQLLSCLWNRPATPRPLFQS